MENAIGDMFILMQTISLEIQAALFRNMDFSSASEKERRSRATADTDSLRVQMEWCLFLAPPMTPGVPLPVHLPPRPTPLSSCVVSVPPLAIANRLSKLAAANGCDAHVAGVGNMEAEGTERLIRTAGLNNAPIGQGHRCCGNKTEAAGLP